MPGPPGHGKGHPGKQFPGAALEGPLPAPLPARLLSSARCPHGGLRGSAGQPGEGSGNPPRPIGARLRGARGRRGWGRGRPRRETGREAGPGGPQGAPLGHGRRRREWRGESPWSGLCVFKGWGWLSAPSSIPPSFPPSFLPPGPGVLGAGRRRLPLTKVCGGGSALPPSPGNKWLATASRGRQQRGCEEEEEAGGGRRSGAEVPEKPQRRPGVGAGPARGL